MTKTLNRSAVALGAALCLSLTLALPAAAQDLNRPMKIVVPFAAGGGGDVLGRLLASKLAESIRQTVIVDNKPGASTIIGTDAVAKSAPDGSTLLLNVPIIVQTMALMSKLPYDPLRDLTVITDMASSPTWMAVNASTVPAKTFREFVDQARTAKYSFASIGPGSTGHLFGTQLNEVASINLLHVPYKGSAPALTALLGGEISAVFLDLVTLKSHVAAGKVRLIAVTGTKRSPMTPDVPTLAELGMKGFESYGWAAIFVPSGTPAPLVARLESEIVKVIRQPDVIAKLADLGFEAGGTPQAQFAAQVRADAERWGAMIRKAGVKVD